MQINKKSKCSSNRPTKIIAKSIIIIIDERGIIL